ncbi:YlxR family protein [Cellulomonas soli]|uniref:YlxR family protein n=1 Tax=Cellulomonas soli TaxID=931535 RepID=UPI0027D9C4E0|nr:YlxR family protein [Cellulomonas soli]
MGCRGPGPRSALLRVVAVTDGTGAPVLVVDERRRMPGRGAWLHPDPDCFELAVRRRAFSRALRLAGPADHTAVQRRLEQSQEDTAGTIPGVEADRRQGSGLEADGCPMSTHR